MGTVADSVKELLGPEREELVRELASAIMRRLYHEAEKEKSEGRDGAIDLFSKEHNEKFFSIARRHNYPNNPVYLVKNIISTLCELEMIKPIQIQSGTQRTLYAITEAGRIITHDWFKKNGSTGIPGLSQSS